MARPRFLADEDLWYPIVKGVVRASTEVRIEFETVQHLGMSGATDPEILEFADRTGWIVVSHDVNTMTRAAEERLASGDGISGLLLIPQERVSREIIDDLILIALASEAEEWRNLIQFLPL